MVLALYPQTTCFYKGVVESPPGTATEDYMYSILVFKMRNSSGKIKSILPVIKLLHSKGY